MLQVKGLGVIHLAQKVTIALSPANEGKTEVVCQASVERMDTLIKLILLGKMRSFGGGILEGIEKRLKRLA